MTVGMISTKDISSKSCREGLVPINSLFPTVETNPDNLEKMGLYVWGWLTLSFRCASSFVIGVCVRLLARDLSTSPRRVCSRLNTIRFQREDRSATSCCWLMCSIRPRENVDSMDVYPNDEKTVASEYDTSIWTELRDVRSPLPT
jgi:hypothetical protein